MKKKAVVALITLFVLSLVFANVAFAQGYTKWNVTFQIINADTFEQIASGTLTTNKEWGTERQAQQDILSQLGFPNAHANQETRKVGNVTQKIIWISCERA
jgi:hypothetical protein